MATHKVPGWVRKCDEDDALGRHLPVPTRIVSNEEYDPPAQTPEQKRVERIVLAMAEAHGGRLGMGRREFLRTSCGMAAAFAAMNTVFGPFFRVDAAELTEPLAGDKTRYFVFDVQTHHVDPRRNAPTPDQEFLDYLVAVRDYGGKLNPKLAGHKASIEELYRLNFIKEVFLDSETAVAVVSGLPQMTRESYIIRPEEIVRTRDAVNTLTGSRRVVAHGTMSPELGTLGLEAMRAQAEKLKVEAWKGYPGQPLGPKGEGWWMDDPKVGYKALELSKTLGIRNICAHKGLPAPGFSAEHCHPKDIMRAALDFPELNFLVYHAGFRGIDEALVKAVESGFTTSSAVPWVTELCEWKKRHPRVSNVYMELGATFGMTAITMPLLTAHMLGMMIAAFGADHVLWGTDSIWWGSPQWQ
ncbi:MAG TPA: amidohydrolase family protein, partial [Thermoanaerobaculia bacterium]|nr:amidohydrolase family protein [Thermoanaerobaculia bacterium]